MRKRLAWVLFAVILLAVIDPSPAAAEDEKEPAAQLAEETTLLTIRRVTALPAGAQGVTFRGTVIWTEGDVLVQDSSGSLRLFSSESLNVGDMILVTGETGEEGFLAEDVTVEGTGPLPAKETTLADAPEGLRVAIRGGTLSQGYLTQDGYSVEVYAEDIPTAQADVYGILLNGIFYADTIVPAAKPDREWKAYFGLLDASSSLSDGLGTIQEAFSHASQVEGLDFFAVTDHSDSFDNAVIGGITRDGISVSAAWAAGKQAAAGVTNDHFAGIFGYEMSWPRDKKVGHINTFATPGWQTPHQPGMNTLAGYCAALAKVPGQVSQFNHPGLFSGDFGGFEDYDPACDACIQLFQLEGEGGESFYDYYLQALDCGWHVAPTVGQDNHHGNWGDEGLSRTGVLAKELTEGALYEAMAARRVYATEDPDFYVDYRLNGNLMGSVMGAAEGLEASVVLYDATDGPEALVEVIGAGGAVLASGSTADGTLSLSVPAGSPYYFLWISQPDGDAAVTAPVWVDDFADMGIAGFTADTDSPLIGQTVMLTLELFNWEEVPFEISGVSLYSGAQKLGDFTSAGGLRYTFPLLWGEPGQLPLTAVVTGAADGVERSYERELTLRFGLPNPVEASIRQVRDGTPGQVFTISGYATSGNTNPDTTFTDMIYVQDDTGGIPARGRFTQRIQVGTPLAVTGVLREENGEPTLEMTRFEVLDKAMYRYVPSSVSCREAMDYALHGGSLVQTEGEVVSVSADGKQVSCFTLRDNRGDTAEIVIDPEIRSGAYGVNALTDVVKVGQTVRVMGLLSREETGQAVLRVRNCDEVVAVEPVPAPTAAPAEVVADESNPPTGDSRIWRLFADVLW